MALSFLLAPVPKWVIVDNYGKLSGGAKLYTYRHLNKTELKPVYQDINGTVPWTNPIIFDLNGTQGPFYWMVDSNSLEDTYYLEAYDSNNNLLWTLDNFDPPGGGGGGGGGTTYISINNYMTNSQMINHIDDKVGNIAPNNSLPTNLVIAPSNHKGFTPALITPIIGAYGALGPDIRFVKNNTNASDSISFPLFPLGSDPLIGDVTPVDYFRYQCTNSPVGETYKSVQWPIIQKVKNLSNQGMTFGIWGAVGAGTATISFYIRQYFGSGTDASPEVRTLIGTATLTTTWNWFELTFTVPSVAGKSLGTAGKQTNDDAIYIQVEMPLGAPCEVFLTKPNLYLGNINPDLDMELYDQIDAVTMSPRTGDIRASYWAFELPGWLSMQDESIGNAGSGATQRANMDTFQLYKTLWDAVSQTWAPVSGGRGSSAVADFLAGKTLTMPRTLGRVLGGAGVGAGIAATQLGELRGDETKSFILQTGQLPPHVHTYMQYVAVTGPGILGNQTQRYEGRPSNTGVGPGNSDPVFYSTMQPTGYVNFFIKL